MTGRRLWMLFPAMLGVVFLVGCSHDPRVPNSISSDELRAQPRLAEGQRAFMQNCNQCHPGGSGGVGPTLNDKKLPPFFVRLKVRHPMGIMPKFPADVLPDAQLDDIVVYMRYVREHASQLEG